eukprot:3778468-Prymnesium_polylepis.1
MPPDYPQAYHLPAGANVAPYSGRGWTTTETCWADMTKTTLDLAKFAATFTTQDSIEKLCAVGGMPPLHPDDFATVIRGKPFTNGKEDTPLVIRLYKDSFAKEFGQASVLRYVSLGWGDDELLSIAKIVASGMVTGVERLMLNDNDFGDRGVLALADAFKSNGGAMPKLLELFLTYNPQITDTGKKALQAAIDTMQRDVLLTFGVVLLDFEA